MPNLATKKDVPFSIQSLWFPITGNKYSGIYLITNKINGNQYVGRSNDVFRRFKEHKSRKKFNSEIGKEIQKFGFKNFDFIILELVDDVSLIVKRECFWISLLNPFLNKNRGGSGNARVPNKKTRDKISAKLKQNWSKKSTLEKNKIVSKQLIGPKKGHAVSEETKNKLRNHNLGKKASLSTRLKISKSLKGKGKENKHLFKPVFCIRINGTVEYFASIKEASEKTGIHPTSICKALKGVQKKAGKLIWKYKN